MANQKEWEIIGELLDGEPRPCIVAQHYTRTPLQQEISALCNQLQTATDAGVRRLLEREIRAKAEEYRSSGADGHVNEQWSIATLDGHLADTFHGSEAALVHDRKALQIARDTGEPWMVVVSLANISDSTRRAGRPGEAVLPALEALKIDRGHDGLWVYLTLALLQSGRVDDARTILRRVPDMADLSDRSSPWRNYLNAYKDEFLAASPAAPEISLLYDAIEEPH